MRTLERESDRPIKQRTMLATFVVLALFFLVACQRSHGDQVVVHFAALPDLPDSGFSLRLNEGEIKKLSTKGEKTRLTIAVDLAPLLEPMVSDGESVWWSSRHDLSLIHI